MAFFFTGGTINGTTDDDIIFGITGGPDYTLNGDLGNDLIISGHHALVSGGNGAGNNSIANAIDIDAMANWFTGYTPLISAWAVPYATIFAEGENDVEYFGVTVGANDFMRLDIDFANFDTFVEILDGSGTVLASNDNGSFIDDGSENETDSLLNFTPTLAGTYYIRVSEVDDGGGETDIETGEYYFLTVNVENHVTGGTTTAGDDTVDGGGGDDIIWTGEGTDTITGGDGNDYIEPGRGTDDVDAGAGDDVVVDRDSFGTSEYDTYDGGAGIDTLDITGTSTTGAEYNLMTGQLVFNSTVIDTFVNFENLTGTNGSTFIGDDGPNELRFVGGNHVNVLNGNGGDDVLEGGRLGDTLDGGNGFDFASYENSLFNAITANLGDPTQNNSDAAGDVYISIEGLIGSPNADNLTGDSGDNIIEGGSGADNIDGGDGMDTASYLRSSAAVEVDLMNSINVGGDAQGDTINNIENLIGSSFADSLTGDAFANTIEGGAGADTLDGGSGIDTLSYAGSGSGVIIVLQTGAAVNGDAGGDSFTGFENVTGSEFGDTLIADIMDNTVTGLGGNDILDGSVGADTLDGGAGNDVFYVDADDTLIGGSGSDYIVVRGYSAGVNFTLSDIEIANGNFQNDSFDASASTVSVVLLGQGGDDTLTGGSLADQLYGSVGNDTLVGNGGNDILNASAGADSLSGGGGDDIIFFDDQDTFLDGGSGYDRIYVEAGSGAVSIDLNATGVEFVQGGAGADTINASGASYDVKLKGGDGVDSILGGSGADFILGEAGNDLITAGAGNDLVFGGSGTDTFIFGAGWGDDHVVDFENGTELIDLTSAGVTSFGQLSITSTGGVATVNFGGNSILLSGLAVTDVDASDFIFAPLAETPPDSKAQVSETLEGTSTLQQDMVAEFMADNAINSPITFTNSQGVLEIITEDDPGYDWDGFAVL